MSTPIPPSHKSRAQIREHLDAEAGDSEFTKEELEEIYALLADRPAGLGWQVFRLRREILDVLSGHLEQDLRRENGQHQTHLRQIEVYHLCRAIEDIAGDEGGDER
jgi:hypothetical protein